MSTVQPQAASYALWKTGPLSRAGELRLREALGHYLVFVTDLPPGHPQAGPARWPATDLHEIWREAFAAGYAAGHDNAAAEQPAQAPQSEDATDPR